MLSRQTRCACAMKVWLCRLISTKFWRPPQMARPRRKISARCWCRNASFHRSFIRQLLAIAPIWLVTRHPRASATCLIWQNIRASVRCKSVRSITWSGRFIATAWPRTKSITFWAPMRVLPVLLPSWARSKTVSFGGTLAPKLRSCLQMAKL